MFYSEDIIDEIINRNDILDVISQYVTLKRSGRYYMGLCPFHRESTPSFSVSPNKQMFYCFGCRKGGNVIHFVSKVENFTFNETIEYLADRAGINLPTSNNQSDNENQMLKKKIYEINELSAKFFHENLYKSTSKLSQEYIKKRKLDNKTLKSFLIGASGNFNELYNFLKEKGYTEKEMLLANVIIKTDEGKYIDRFRKRIMIPIFDTKNRVIAFGGRTLEDRKDIAKYINTSENLVYSKGRNLFAWNLAKKSDSQDVIIVEGYMDAISLYQRGIDNVVASLGTALTESQGRLLTSKKKVIISYDSDAAGQAATIRGLDILHNIGLDVRVLQMEGAKDPDEYIIKFGSAGFKNLIENAISLVEFKIKVFKNDLNLNDITDKIKFLNQIAKVLSTINNNIEKEIYIDKISNEYKISKEAIYSEVNKLVYNESKSNKILGMSKVNSKINIPKEQNLSKNEKKEELIIKLLVTAQYKAYDKLHGKITPDYFKKEINREIVTILYNKYSEFKSDIDDILSLYNNEEIINKLSYIMMNDFEIVDVDKCINDIIKNYEQDNLINQRNEIINKLKNTNLSKEEENKLENELSNILIKIAQSK